MRSGRRDGFFSSRWKIIAVVALGALLLGGGLIIALEHLRPQTEEAPAPNPVATITMSDGSAMRFELFPSEAPNTVANFIDLARSRFYDGLQFYRIVAGVFIQGGDPNNDGTGGPDYAIKGEFSENGVPNHLSHLRGTLSMARQQGFDTAGSQFFIMQGSYPEYDGKYAAFGKAMDDETLATLDAIAAQPTDSTYLPLTRQVISTVRVETFDVDYDKPEKLERAGEAENGGQR